MSHRLPKARPGFSLYHHSDWLHPPTYRAIQGSPRRTPDRRGEQHHDAIAQQQSKSKIRSSGVSDAITITRDGYSLIIGSQRSHAGREIGAETVRHLVLVPGPASAFW